MSEEELKDQPPEEQPEQAAVEGDDVADDVESSLAEAKNSDGAAVEGEGSADLEAESDPALAGEAEAMEAAEGEPAGTAADGPDVAQAEAEIRQELGIGGGKIEIDQTEVDRLLTDAVVGYEQVFAGTALDQGAAPLSEPSSLGAQETAGTDVVEQNLGLLRDVNMKVKVELGRGRMYLKDILRLAQGSVVELERLAGDPLDIYVNEKVIARGEVLVLNENFCIRITEIFSPAEVLAQEV
ncbi:MAG: flagellar motor switch protein FliN [Planctomycetota bacterium]